MIYSFPAPDDAIDQGDIICDCPVVLVEQFPTSEQANAEIPIALNWVYTARACPFLREQPEALWTANLRS